MGTAKACYKRASVCLGGRNGYYFGRLGTDRVVVEMRKNRKYAMLYYIRRERDLTPSRIAMETGIPSARYVAIERKDAKVTANERAVIARYLNMEEAELFRSADDMVIEHRKCKSYKMDLPEMEKMLADMFGDKLKPRRAIKCSS